MDVVCKYLALNFSHCIPTNVVQAWYILTLIFLLISSPLSAQSSLDSLKNELQNARGQERAELLLELAGHTRQKNIEKAILQAKEALDIAKRLEEEELQSKSLQSLGFYYSIADQDTTALGYLLSALKLERQHGHRIAESAVLHNLGRFYMVQDNHAKALDYFFQALRIQLEKEKKTKAASTLSFIGDVYRNQNDLEQAVSFYKKATQLAQEVKNYRIISIAGVKAGNNLHEIGHFEEASHYFDLALKAAKTIPSVHAEAGILLVMSNAYQDENLYIKALALNKKLLKIAKQHESKILLARGYENLAGIYTAEGNLKRANGYYLTSIKMYKAIEMPIAEVAHKLMQNYLNQGFTDKAIQTGENSMLQVKNSTSLKNEQILLKSLIKAYQKKGDFQKTASAQQALMAINEALFNETKSEQIAEMQTRYETRQKEQEIDLLEKKQEKATLLRNALLIGLLLLVIIAVLVFNRQHLKIRKNKINRENSRLKRAQLKQELKFKNKQLTTQSLNLVQKNEVMKELKQRIQQFQDNSGEKPIKELKNITRLVDYSFNLDKDWEEFRLYFEEVHLGFFDVLKKDYPDLTNNELRLSALIKLNLTIKEISTILNISPDSVKTARYRLRKKLKLETAENLSEFLRQMEHDATSYT